MTTAAGWSTREFDEAPLPVIFDLLEYWADNPPTHVIQAAKAGLGKRKRVRKQVADDTPYRELTSMEQATEQSLPTWVQKVREKRREERKQKQYARQ